MRALRDVAIVSFARRPRRAASGSATRSRCSSPCIAEAIDRSAIPTQGDRLHRLGELRLPRRAPLLLRHGARRRGRLAPHRGVARRDGRRVGALRGVGAPPARRHRRGARLRVRALVAGRRARRARACSSIPTTWRRSGPTRSSLAALQARALLDAGRATERDMAEVAAAVADARARTRTRSSPRGRGRRRAARRAVPRRRRSAGTTARRSPTARARWCSPPATARAGCCARPGVDPRHRSPHRAALARRARSHPLALDDARRREGRRRTGARSTSPRSTRPSRTRRSSSATRSAWAPDVDVNPSGGALAANPSWSPGSPASARRRSAILDGERAPRGRPRHQRVRACSRTSSACWRRDAMNRCAVIGIGQTKHAAKRDDVSIAGLVREAAVRALEDAGLRWADIDAVVIGKAPDMFEGVMMPELYLADALGAAGKPMMRVHTAGQRRRLDGDRRGAPRPSRACTSACSRSPSRSSRRATRCGRSRRGIRSSRRSSPARAATSRRSSARYIRRSGAPADVGHDGRGEGSPERAQEPVRAPAHARHLARDGARLADAVGSRSATWRPARRPTARARWCSRARSAAKPRADASRRGCARPRCAASRRCSRGAIRSTRRAGRDCAADALPAGRDHRSRAARSTSPRSTCPSRWFEPMWMENLGFAPENEGWKMTRRGRHRARRRAARSTRPAACSRPTPSAPPGCSASPRRRSRCAGRAGAHQVDGAQVAMGHAYGGGSQFFAMWIVGSERP